jgi:hypothetical protein
MIDYQGLLYGGGGHWGGGGNTDSNWYPGKITYGGMPGGIPGPMTMGGGGYPGYIGPPVGGPGKITYDGMPGGMPGPMTIPRPWDNQMGRSGMLQPIGYGANGGGVPGPMPQPPNKITYNGMPGGMPGPMSGGNIQPSPWSPANAGGGPPPMPAGGRGNNMWGGSPGPVDMQRYNPGNPGGYRQGMIGPPPMQRRFPGNWGSGIA